MTNTTDLTRHDAKLDLHKRNKEGAVRLLRQFFFTYKILHSRSIGIIVAVVKEARNDRLCGNDAIKARSKIEVLAPECSDNQRLSTLICAHAVPVVARRARGASSGV